MDFREFLIAAGRKDWVELIERQRWDVLESVSSKLNDLLRQYYYVGGMPEVVDCFLREKDLNRVRQIQLSLLESYRNDVSKHAPKEHIPRINMVMRSIPSQLAKENKKFIYGVLKPGARAREYELAIQWLIDCGILHKVSCVSDAKAPLAFYENLSSFKLFFLDCGLLAAMAGVSSELMLVDNRVFTEFKGAFTEQYVLQQLLCRENAPIYYWASESTAEVDFIIERDGVVFPIEVKAEQNVKAKSLHLLVNRHKGMKGIRFSMLPFKDQDWVTNYPLYSV